MENAKQGLPRDDGREVYRGWPKSGCTQKRTEEWVRRQAEPSRGRRASLVGKKQRDTACLYLFLSRLSFSRTLCASYGHTPPDFALSTILSDTRIPRRASPRSLFILRSFGDGCLDNRCRFCQVRSRVSTVSPKPVV